MVWAMFTRTAWRYDLVNTGASHHAQRAALSRAAVDGSPGPVRGAGSIWALAIQALSPP